jgi:hypothetical protein
MINLGFLLREKLAAVLIIPSSWVPNWMVLNYQHRAASPTPQIASQVSNFVLPILHRACPIGNREPFLFTISRKPSWWSHDNSNDNIDLFPTWACSPESISNGVWSEPVRVRALTETKGNLFSHSTLASTRSSFWKVGISRLLAQVYCLPESSISLRSRLSIIALDINGHLAIKLSLCFSSFLLKILKSPL